MPRAPMYAPTPNRVAPRRNAPTTTAAAESAPSTPPTAPAIVSGVSPMKSPIAPPRIAPTTAAAPIASTFVPRMPVIATDRPSPRPRQRPTVYQLPIGASVEASIRTVAGCVLNAKRRRGRRRLGEARSPGRSPTVRVILDLLDHGQPEGCRACAVDHAVVERDGDRSRASDDDGSIAHDWPRRNPSDAQDRHLGVVHDRRLEEARELPCARDRERRAAQLLGGERAAPSPLRKL